MKQLHSSKILNLCDLVQGRPVLLVNTASHCGFTKQFGDLEKIHQQYKDQGLVVIGVSSDSFNQEADDEAAAADVCFKNFGVSFTMLATVPVKGAEAHPLFKEVARQDTAPKWNFYKYLVNRQGQIVDSNSSMTLPSDKALRKLLAAE
ncbi:glutathione peroxidase [Venatoribacter cucullus]|uniref:glutathione peroxidase n=1 Tax=Venatoribacter cucullus TaxID=2661630 RepID=UPI00223FEBFD|nr:redoxin domain-containing protein [Venatoribacter cucullus]